MPGIECASCSVEKLLWAAGDAEPSPLRPPVPRLGSGSLGEDPEAHGRGAGPGWPDGWRPGRGWAKGDAAAGPAAGKRLFDRAAPNTDNYTSTWPLCHLATGLLGHRATGTHSAFRIPNSAFDR